MAHENDGQEPPNLGALGEGIAVNEPWAVFHDLASAKARVKQGDVGAIVLVLSSPDDELTALLPGSPELAETKPPVVVLGSDVAESAEATFWRRGAFEVLRASPEAPALAATIRRALHFRRMAWSFRRERAHMASVLAHDLKNPLSAVLMTAHMLRTRLDEKDKPAVERIRRAGQRMHRMIQEMVDFAHLRQGTALSLRLNLCDLGRLCRNAIDELARAQPGHKVVFENERSLSGMWDGERLEQLVFHLLSHGLSSGLASEGAVLKLETDASTEVVLTVSCRGSVPAGDLTNLFDPLSGDPRSDGGRADMGLYIARAIAQAHGGELGVGAGPDGSLVVTLRLPRSGVSSSMPPA